MIYSYCPVPIMTHANWWSTTTVLCPSWPTPTDDLQLLSCVHHDPRQLTVLFAEDEEEVSNQVLDLSHRWRQQLTQPAHHPKVGHHPRELSDVLFQATQSLAFEKHQGRTGKGSCMFSGLRKGGKNKKQVALHAFMLHPVSKAMLGPFSERWHSTYGLSLIACCVVLPSSPSPSHPPPPTITCHVASYPPHLPPSPPTITVM